MRIPRWLAAFLMLMAPAAAHADDHRADISGAFSYAKGSKLLGMHQAFAHTLPDREQWSVVGDFAVYFGSDEGRQITRATYMVGPRLTLSTQSPHHKVLPYALFGGIYNNDDLGGTTDGAIAFGAGWEYIQKPAVQGASSHGLGFRAQADYVINLGDRDSFPRLSAGLVYRFRK